MCIEMGIIHGLDRGDTDPACGAERLADPANLDYHYVLAAPGGDLTLRVRSGDLHGKAAPNVPSRGTRGSSTIWSNARGY
jgi:hypothetical protein